MMPNSMLQPSPISTTLAFSSRVRWDCSVALILSISALVMTVAVVGFPGLGWAYIATGIRTVAASRTFSAVFLMVFLLKILRLDPARGRLLHRRRLIQQVRENRSSQPPAQDTAS